MGNNGHYNYANMRFSPHHLGEATMPITMTFDIEEASINDANDRTRINLAFERLGWENLGGSCWRYPSLGGGGAHPSEDWFNNVIPALMYFRSIVEHSGMNVTQFTIDAHSEAGYRQLPAPVGQPIELGANVGLHQSAQAPNTQVILSEQRLRRFITDAANSL